MSAFDYDMIDRYLDNEMTPEERRAFEEQMQQDEALKKEVALYKEVNDTLRLQLYPDKEENALRETLEGMREEYFLHQLSDKPQAKVVRFTMRRWMAAAASLAVIIVAALFFWTTGKKSLYNQYAYTQMPAVEERGAPGDSLLKIATEKFNDKKYSQTLSLFEEILTIDSQSSYVHYYYSIALLEVEQVEKARTELNPLYNGNSLFKYDAAFYMALSYLKQKDKQGCIDWLNKIPPEASAYKKAQELLKKL